jgi:type I restriction enzyme, S subunit
MKSGWRFVKLGDVLYEVSRPEPVDPLREYTTLGVRWYAQGLFAKDKLMGHQIAAPKIYRVEAGDFVYNRLFAWKGSFAVADSSVSNCFVSNEFPCFRSDERILDVRYLHSYFRQEFSWTAALGLSSGATPTSRNRLKEAAFLSLKVPLPPIEEQKRIVARIDEVHQHLMAADTLRKSAFAELHAICRALVLNDPSTKQLVVGEVVRQKPLNVIVEPDVSYQFAGVYSFGRGVFKGGVKTGTEFAYPKLSRIKSGDFIYPKLMAWEGALGVVPDECDGCVVSPEFPVFEIDQTKVLPDVFDVYFRDPSTWESLQGGSTGTNARRRRLNPSDFLKLKIPVPNIATQRKLATIRLHQKKLISLSTDAESSAVLASLLNTMLIKQ